MKILICMLTGLFIFMNEAFSDNVTETQTESSTRPSSPKAASISTSTSQSTSSGPQLTTVKDVRRILKGTPTGDIRPYMVYLKAASAMKKKMAERVSAKKKKKNQNKNRMKRLKAGRQKTLVENSEDHKYWLCGGVIVHPEYVLTSAACIEDVQQFYVISGTSKWNVEDEEDSCASNGALRATWKCVDQDYHYDGKNYDNIQWMKHDVAVVRVERPFNFTHKVLGCEFIPQKIIYNNYSVAFEKPGTVGTIAGWGSTSKFFTTISDYKEEDDDEPVARNAEEKETAAMAINPELLEAEVKIMSKRNCKKVWDGRYHEVIDGEILCSRDVIAGRGTVCDEAGAKCVDIVYSEEDDDDDDDPVQLRSASHKKNQARTEKFLKSDRVKNVTHKRRAASDDIVTGGFCENDHGGPMIVGHGKKALVVGIMTAAFVNGQAGECRGPFLFTSVFKHTNLINCAISKQSVECKSPATGGLRTREVAFNWDI